MSIKNTLKEIILKVLHNNDLGLTINDINIKKDKDGNYLSDIALIIENKLNISSKEIIKEIYKEIKLSNMFSNIDIIESGIIKFNTNKDYLLSNINTIIEKKEEYGKNNLGNNKRINIEFISTKDSDNLSPEDIRKVIYIDNLAKIMNLCGYDVNKEYYINNDIDIEENHYKNSIITNIKEYLDKYRIYFEEYNTKQLLYNKGIIEEVLTKLKYTPSCYINDDALCLKTSDYGTKDDIEIIDKDGNYTNIVPYIAYQYYKIKQGYNTVINTETPELIDFLPYIEASLKILEIDPKQVENKHQGQVNLINYNERLMNNLNTNTKRFYYSCYNFKQDMDFDLNLASSNNMDNPVYFIEETNATICSIINNNKKNIHKVEKYVTIKEELTYTIADKLQTYEDIIIEACNKRKPSLITNYTYELASLFQKLYTTEEIITDDEIYTNERLNLLLAIKIVLNNSLNLIGIIPREECRRII